LSDSTALEDYLSPPSNINGNFPNIQSESNVNHEITSSKSRQKPTSKSFMKSNVDCDDDCDSDDRTLVDEFEDEVNFLF